ncbi:MAG: hypothetical protein AAFP69_15625, partial [Planctomycetota bacterium]
MRDNAFLHRTFFAVIAIVSLLMSTPIAQCEDETNGRNDVGDLQRKCTRIIDRHVHRMPKERDWPDGWEHDFWERANLVVRETTKEYRKGNTWFENEKRSYGLAMLAILGGREDEAVKFLQEPDAAKQWNEKTLGVDYYACFTLKHQIRKYRFFGDFLSPEYRRTMRRAAQIFTKVDPLNRHNDVYEGKQGWGPDAKNSWVDVRNTDNLRLMRATSVYLMAEESGNRDVATAYKRRLHSFFDAMFRYGINEWDSENYLGHSISPLLNLHDFAADPLLRSRARNALDYLSLCCALKYLQGTFGGPTKRDYNHPFGYGGSAASLAWVWFGGPQSPPTQWESDEVHAITSSYRPPRAVVHLAHRSFSGALELLSAKPLWTHMQEASSTDAAVRDSVMPQYFETNYLSRSVQLGSLRRGTQGPDVNGFKLLIANGKRPADVITAAPVSDPMRIGSVVYQKGLLAPNSAVGQNGNLLVYLTQENDTPYHWWIPKDATVRRRGHVTLIAMNQATVAIWPINMRPIEKDPDATRRVQFRRVEKKKRGKIIEVKDEPRWPHTSVYAGHRSGKGLYGFALEVCEHQTMPGPEFQRAAMKVNVQEDERLVRGAVAITGVSGRRIRLQWGNSTSAIHIWRDGKEYRPDRQSATSQMFATLHASQDGASVDMPWNTGRLTVR